MVKFEIIEEAVYNLCVEANTVLPDSVFSKIFSAYELEKNKDAKQVFEMILKNAKTAYNTQKPLCQDTGQVLVFVKIGENTQVEKLNDAINSGVKKAYEENFFRKSVVKNALFQRENTNTNIPCIIYPEFVQGNELELQVLIKGAGSENMSQIKMLSPTATEDEIVDCVKQAVFMSGSKPCPPIFIGVGIGGTMEYAGLLSKKALLLEQDIDENHKNLASKIKKACNSLNVGPAGVGCGDTVLDVKLITDFTHIACMPLAVTINCHSSRHAKCTIENDEIIYDTQTLVAAYNAPSIDFSDFIRVDTSDIKKLKSLKRGQKILLSGEIYTARDMAHKKLVEMLEKGEKLPFDINDKIIFYAGPCPCSSEEIIGSVGPTTSARMDKYAPVLYKKGLLATIGKGERSEDVKKAISSARGLYFTMVGGISSYLIKCFKGKEMVAFEELGTEAVVKLQVQDLPLLLELS